MEPRYTNLDASESAFFARQLEKIRSKVYEVRYPENKARQLIPSQPDPAADGDEKVVYRQEDVVGEAKIINKASTGDDLPMINVKGEEFEQPLRDVGLGFSLTLGEVRKAAREGTDLRSKMAEKTRRLSERKLDEILALGDSAAKLKGFLNHSAVSATNVSGGAWSGKNPDQIIADLNEPAQTILDTTKGLYGHGLRIVLPEAKYAVLSQTRLTDTAETLLSFYLRTNPFVKEILPWYRCKGAGSGGADRMVVYPHDPDVLTAEVPVEFEILDAQPKGFTFFVPTRLVTGGVIVTQPKAMVYRDAF